MVVVVVVPVLVAAKMIVVVVLVVTEVDRVCHCDGGDSSGSELFAIRGSL